MRGGSTMLLWVLLVVAALLVAYLLYALVNPEAFQ
jgi:K+-transporting ATPase KdpF subunit